MHDVVTFIVGVVLMMVIIWTAKSRSSVLRDAELKKANRDLNIEFGSSDGIELVKKNYPNLELKDDKRTGLEDANKS